MRSMVCRLISWPEIFGPMHAVPLRSSVTARAILGARIIMATAWYKQHAIADRSRRDAHARGWCPIAIVRNHATFSLCSTHEVRACDILACVHRVHRLPVDVCD